MRQNCGERALHLSQSQETSTIDFGLHIFFVRRGCVDFGQVNLYEAILAESWNKCRLEQCQFRNKCMGKSRPSVPKVRLAAGTLSPCLFQRRHDVVDGQQEPGAALHLRGLSRHRALQHTQGMESSKSAPHILSGN